MLDVEQQSMASLNKSVLDFSAIIYSVEYYSSVIVGGIGILANLMNILVGAQRALQKNTLGFYNIHMSIFNILTLIFVCFLSYLPQSNGSHEQLIQTSSLNCKFISYFLRIFAAMSSWINVMVTMDRMLCVCLINRFKFVHDKNKLLLIVLAVFAIICCIYMPSLFFHLESRTIFDAKTNETLITYDCTAPKSTVVIRDMLAVGFRIVLPRILHAVMNTVIVYKLFEHKHRMLINRPLEKEFRFAFTIVVLNVMLFVTELPFIGSVILMNVYGYGQTYAYSTNDESAIFSFVNVCSLVMSSLFFVAIFFVNLITNKIFRKAFINLFRQVFSYFHC